MATIVHCPIIGIVREMGLMMSIEATFPQVSLSARCCIKWSAYSVLFIPMKPSPHKNLKKGKLFAPGYSTGEQNRLWILSHELTLCPWDDTVTLCGGGCSPSGTWAEAGGFFRRAVEGSWLWGQWRWGRRSDLMTCDSTVLWLRVSGSCESLLLRVNFYQTSWLIICSSNLEGSHWYKKRNSPRGPCPLSYPKKGHVQQQMRDRMESPRSLLRGNSWFLEF